MSLVLLVLALAGSVYRIQVVPVSADRYRALPLVIGAEPCRTGTVHEVEGCFSRLMGGPPIWWWTDRTGDIAFEVQRGGFGIRVSGRGRMLIHCTTRVRRRELSESRFEFGVADVNLCVGHQGGRLWVER